MTIVLTVASMVNTAKFVAVGVDMWSGSFFREYHKAITQTSHDDEQEERDA